MSITLTIRSDESPEQKSRSFSAHILAYATYPSFWDGGVVSDTIRPVYLLAATSDAEARSVVENLRLSRKARGEAQAMMRGAHLPTSGVAVEFPRSAGYRYELQRTPEGTLLTAYLPALFDFQPGVVDPDRVRFIILPATEDLGDLGLTLEEKAAARCHAESLGYSLEGESDLVATAVLWAAYLDERSEVPIPPEPDFRLQLHLAVLKAGLASRGLPLGTSATPGDYAHESFGYSEYIAPGLRLSPGVACNVAHADLRALLATELQRYEFVKAKRSALRSLHAPPAPTLARTKKKRTPVLRRDPHVTP